MPLENIHLCPSPDLIALTLHAKSIGAASLTTTLTRTDAKKLADQLAKWAEFKPAPTDGVLIHRRNHTTNIQAWRDGRIDWAECVASCQTYRLFWLATDGTLYDINKQTGEAVRSDLHLHTLLRDHMDTTETNPFITTHLS